MKIIVAVDQTNNWQEIIDSVTRSCWPNDAQFKVLTVVEPIPNDAQNSPIVNACAKQIESQKRKHAEKILSLARTRLIECLRDAQVHTELREGAAAIEILEAATQWMPDKIIVGAHGANPNRLLPGRLSRSVARHAICSVEIVRLKSTASASLDDMSKAALITAEPMART
ncbi:MAG: universal stress protein [Candidatus Obscuribacterales bacterium]|nr:universal stress protein [Candidatus Obscuribacterales bacterium]